MSPHGDRLPQRALLQFHAGRSTWRVQRCPNTRERRGQFALRIRANQFYVSGRVVHLADPARDGVEAGALGGEHAVMPADDLIGAIERANNQRVSLVKAAGGNTRGDLLLLSENSAYAPSCCACRA